MASILKVDELQGITAAGDITVTSEGGAATQSLQQGLAKAWINFNGTGTIATRDSLNNSSLTDGGTGNYTVGFSSSFSNSNYAPICSGVTEYNHSRGPTFQIQVGIAGDGTVISKTTSQITHYGGLGSTGSSNGQSYDHIENYVAHLGDLA